MAPDKLTSSKLDEISRKHLKNYMNEIAQHGGVDHEVALLSLFVQITVTLDTQKGKNHTKKVVEGFLEGVYGEE